jgi:radical SAM superfamily enzyme YgiQ (UPF0313 family)
MTEKDMCQEKSTKGSAPQKIKLVALNAKYIHSCLALFYIRNELKLHYPQAEVEILQLTINDNLYENLLRITLDQPFAVFFSAAIWNSDRIAQLTSDVRRCLPECRIVVGGPQAGVLREQLPENVCSMVIGEIEAVDTSFYRDLASGELAAKYTGSFLKQKSKQLDYPFCDEDFQDQLRNRHIYYETSRGCPHSCTYCLSASERGLFHKDLAQVKKELGHILQFKPKVVRFVDRTFNDVPERALAIWEFLLGQEGDTLFHFEIAPDRFTEEMFTLLERVEHGRFQFEIGIQSTHNATLEAIRRWIDTSKVHAIIERLTALNTIHLHVDLILGLPFDTATSFAKSFSDVYAMGAHYIQMGLLKILPDTPICHGAEEYGYIHSSHTPYSIFANNWLSHNETTELYWFCECVEKFYNNRYFVSLWRYLRQQREMIFEFFQELLIQGQKIDFLHRSVTQELLCSILVDVCSRRKDKTLITELLRYDWMRCGFRTLPDCLAFGEGEEGPGESKDILYQQLPDQMDDMYTHRSRNQFFKRSIFLRLSSEASSVLALGEDAQAMRITFLQERDSSLYQHNKVAVLQNI